MAERRNEVAPTPAAVVPLRRRWPTALLAAAAVAAIGFGTTQVLGGGSDDAVDAGSAGSEASDEGGGRSAERAPGPQRRSDARVLAGLDVAGLEPAPRPSSAAESERLAPAAPDGWAYSSRVCGPRPPVPGAREIPAVYRDSPALVLVYPAEAGERRAEVFVCDGPSPRRPTRTVVLADGE